ncbi:MAG: methyltransferase domain-containing protein [Anaerolineae bacterium]|nr:methyltransferase domain-containing protein [Anaerolineae bacterium]
MRAKGLTTQVAQRLYDRIARWYALLDRFESRAKARGVALLNPRAGDYVLDVGAGPGRELRVLAKAAARLIVGLDISTAMLQLAREQAQVPLVQANAVHLPFCPNTFDRILCAYVLDLMPPDSIIPILREYHRVLAPQGQAVVITMTEGVNLSSKAIVSLWKGIYAVSPTVCGGCRPLHLAPRAQAAGLSILHREVVVEFGVPSEVLLLEKTDRE